MKKILIVLGITLIVGTLLWQSEKPFGQGSEYNSFSSPTHATSSLGIYAWSNVLNADSGRQYMNFCNDGLGIVYLGLGATSTFASGSHTGIRINSGSCFEMSKNNMFTGIVYGLASSSTSTISSTYK